jgi:4-hydroxy-tetrahydrodipicolinate synthase
MSSHFTTPAFSGIWVPIVTPFLDGAVDHRALGKLVRYYAAAGVDGLVPLGTTGEAYALDDAEYDAVLDTVLDAAGTLRVIAGLGGMHATDLLRRVSAVSARDVAGVLLAAPPYMRPSQDALMAHFSRVAEASAKPVVLYDIPYRTGVTLSLDTLYALAAHPNIVAIKDCGGSVDKTQALIADGRLAVLAGEDINVFATLCMGAAGAIAASANVAPRQFVRLARAIKANQLDEARAIFHRLSPLIRTLFSEPNPAPVKAWLAMAGMTTADVRAPLIPASAALMAELAIYSPD